METPMPREDTLNPVARAAFARVHSAAMITADRHGAFPHVEAPAWEQPMAEEGLAAAVLAAAAIAAAGTGNRKF
jgi:hypothetical protein